MLSESSRRNGALILAAVLLVLAVSITVMRRPARSGAGYWYMDVRNGELFAVAGHELPPVPAPSGAEGVRAYVFGCGSCEPADRVIAYIEKFTDEGKAWQRNRPLDETSRNPGHLLSAVQNGQPTQWVSADSEAGYAIMVRVNQVCPDQRKICSP